MKVLGNWKNDVVAQIDALEDFDADEKEALKTHPPS